MGAWGVYSKLNHLTSYQTELLKQVLYLENKTDIHKETRGRKEKASTSPCIRLRSRPTNTNLPKELLLKVPTKKAQAAPSPGRCLPEDMRPQQRSSPQRPPRCSDPMGRRDMLPRALGCASSFTVGLAHEEVTGRSRVHRLADFPGCRELSTGQGPGLPSCFLNSC